MVGALENKLELELDSGNPCEHQVGNSQEWQSDVVGTTLFALCWSVLTIQAQGSREPRLISDHHVAGCLPAGAINTIFA